TGRTLGEEKVLHYAYELEGHADNVTPSVMGSLVLTCLTEEGKIKYIRSDWPRELKVIAVVPSFRLSTEKGRGILPSEIPLLDRRVRAPNAGHRHPPRVHPCPKTSALRPRQRGSSIGLPVMTGATA
ncbi:MAG TPA: hypothetical protein VNM72_08915, partial [Blastocatellia bacterium]|nr:hypothetical protein [Blastocatellia bacterium]